MRLFIAANLPESITGALEDNLADLQDAGVEGRYTQTQNLHLTLTFLGNQGEDHLDAIKSALDRTASACVAPDIELSDYGVFEDNSSPSRPKSTTLWQGLVDATEVGQLAQTLRSHLEEAGIGFDKSHPFAAHVTLVRKATLADTTAAHSNGQTAAQNLLNALEEPWVDQGAIESITLYQSQLSAEGPTYTPLHTAKLLEPYRHPQGRLLIIDADACPVTKEAIDQARCHRTPVLLVGNGTQNLSKHLAKKDPRAPQPGFWAATMNVLGGADSADFQIATVVQAGDIVVTQDFGVAAMALGAGAQALGVRGREYTKAGIDALMLVRHEEKKLRRQGGRTQGPRAFTGEDHQRFSSALRRMLER